MARNPMVFCRKVRNESTFAAFTRPVRPSEVFTGTSVTYAGDAVRTSSASAVPLTGNWLFVSFPSAITLLGSTSASTERPVG